MKKTSTSCVVAHIQKIVAELSQLYDKEHQIAANILMDYIKIQNNLLNVVLESYRFTGGFGKTDKKKKKIKKEFWNNVRKTINKNNGKIKKTEPPLYDGELYYGTKTFIIKRNGAIIHHFDCVNYLRQADNLIQQEGFVRKYDWGVIHNPTGTISTCLLVHIEK